MVAARTRTSTCTSLVRADALKTLLFQNAQHFRLGAQAHVADFIEKERAAIGFLKFADFIFAGPGETAFDVAE